MDYRLTLEKQEWNQSTPAAFAVGDPDENLPGADSSLGKSDATPAAVFPAPLTTLAAAAIGGLIGLAMVYGVAARLADTLVGVSVIVLVFAMTMAGPRVHAAARTETGRILAVILEAIAFGGAVGALIVLI
ncbi:hypothetical protein [Rhodococcus sp. IEGM 1408]|uniref:hypothetical protein n=1 Tax=Rhodococcus sp. IEGM 1408 TaxID=3082220 RepID=UPI00295413E3|nr:hypothetical protein [Rhodococcus sp. IEGM 1408]MDV8001955.1 hypothetical protein [Rhodococcus sp. IEGM 1408]